MAASGSTALKAQWLDAAGHRPCLVVVRRGDETTFGFLQEHSVRRSNDPWLTHYIQGMRGREDLCRRLKRNCPEEFLR
jgi:hypothetical protein